MKGGEEGGGGGGEEEEEEAKEEEEEEEEEDANIISIYSDQHLNTNLYLKICSNLYLRFTTHLSRFV
jgi:hypothetical protein